MKLFPITLAALIAGSAAAQAAPVTVEIWDVLAPEPGCCNGNDEDQQAAAQGTTPKNNIVLSPGTNGKFFDTAFVAAGDFGDSETDRAVAGVDYIVDTLDPDLTFSIESSALAAGFSAVGLSNSSASPSINTVFGVSEGGVGDNSILGTVARLTGFADVEPNAPDFNVTSDDGYRVTLGGDVLAEITGLQGPTTRPHGFGTVEGDHLPFEMLWFEANVTDMALQVEKVNFVAPVPLPAGLPLLLAGLGAIGLLRARQSRG